MKVGLFTPLPPARTGVAHYASMLIPALRERVDLEVNGQPSAVDRIYQLGNNPHHEWIYREAMTHPGVVVLHDVVLHHLIVEMTLARGDVEGYVAALEANHGAVGAAWARGRAAGLHSEMGNFLLPASIELARRSRSVIVHNRWAADRLRSFGVTTPIIVAPHPAPSFRAAKTARNLGGGRIIGFFGFLTSAKRAEVVLEAFRRARKRDPALRLIIAGEAAPNIDVSLLSGEGVEITGYLPEEELERWFKTVDRLVNLRYPSAGETSGTLIRAFAAGKPVAVSDYAQFSEYPDECVTKIPLGDGEVEALADFFLRDIDSAAVAAAQREWLDQNAAIEKTVEAYMEALISPGVPLRDGVVRTISLFPRLEIAARRFGDELRLTLRNRGEITLRAREYAQPAYRGVVKLFAGSRQVDDRWVSLPGDLAPDQSIDITLPLYGPADRLTFQHALQGIPLVGSRPDVEVPIAGV